MTGGSHSDDVTREEVRARYARAATIVLDIVNRPAQVPDRGRGQEAANGMVQPAQATPFLEMGTSFGSCRYTEAELSQVPVTAVAASLGCGSPTAKANLQEGERVLDLGCGGGIDVLLSAKRLGPSGFAYGIDMTFEMIDLARANASRDGATNVAFIVGHMEAVPLADRVVDVVISNSAINLSTRKSKVMDEIFRVLVSGGRLWVADIVAEDRLGMQERFERVPATNSVAGVLSCTEYLEGLRKAGLHSPSVFFTHEIADGMHGAIIMATKSL